MSKNNTSKQYMMTPSLLAEMKRINALGLDAQGPTEEEKKRTLIEENDRKNERAMASVKAAHAAYKAKKVEEAEKAKEEEAARAKEEAARARANVDDAIARVLMLCCCGSGRVRAL